MSVNKVVIEGRVTFAELRQTPSGVSVTSFQVAVPRPYQKDKEQVSDFIDCVAWRGTADFIANHFPKGTPISFDGRLRVENYTDKDGNKRKRSYVLVEGNVNFVTAPPKNNGNNTGAFEQPAPEYASADNSDFEEIGDDDDLPF